DRSPRRDRMESRRSSYGPNGSSTYSGWRATSRRARDTPSSLAICPGAEQPTAARARNLPAGGLRSEGAAAAGVGGVGLRPLRGSYVAADRRAEPRMVAMARWWTRRRDPRRHRPPGGSGDRRGTPGRRRRPDLRARPRPARAHRPLAGGASEWRTALRAANRDAERPGLRTPGPGDQPLEPAPDLLRETHRGLAWTRRDLLR